MSIVLSIHSQKGFREVTLPERGQNELRVLIRKELFDLNEDASLLLEKVEKRDHSGYVWELEAVGGHLRMNGRPYKRATISVGMQMEAEFRGRKIAVLISEQKNPFTAYRKYALAGKKEITVGWNAENMIQYQDLPTKEHYVSGNHCSLVVKNGAWELHDSSKNGTYVNFKRVYGTTVLQYGDSIRVMRLNLIFLGNMLAVNECEGLTVNMSPVESGPQLEALASRPGAGASAKKILFHRSPRNLRKLHTDPIEIEAPPPPQAIDQQPALLQIGPSLTMAIPMVLGSALSVLGNNSGSSMTMYAGMIVALASAVIGAVWAMAGIRYAGKTRRQAENRRFESYSEYLIRMRDKIEALYKENAKSMRDCSLSADECCALDGHSPLLWNRNESYDDFLAVRLGMGDLPFQAPIQVPKERFTLINDTLADKPRQLQENFSILKDVPVSVDLLKNRLVGVAGGENRKASIAIAQAMIAQIAAANCYTDVKIAIICDEKSDIDRDAWNFAMWLPHVWSGDKKIRYMATNRAERGDVFYALTQILRNRNEEDERNRSLKPRIVLFVSDPTLLDGEAIAHYVFDRENDLGLSTVLLTGKPEELPNACECVIEYDAKFQGIYDTRNGQAYGTTVKFDRVSVDRLWNFSKGLGRVEVVDSEQEGEIPNSLTFFDMFGVSNPEELQAATRWQKSDVTKSMRALVGFRSGNAPCYLDINEKYHGPHGLVAGTTGSGKSETLQTYILSLAVNYSPEDIGFFIIDYKGGGMANLFDNLPHMIGSISNLSGNQVKRAMVSIQSENRRRQRIFTEYGGNNINGYTALYKSGDAAEPVPHLFIIIDEFAELKREEPEFMKELISVAQVGRSLGVHMILSTQRPSGTVDENIWANSKFRLCLRVQDRQDSMDMLHRVEAAYLTQAGRCYLQVGNDEIFELFQSGWSGASYDKELGSGSLLVAQMLSMTGKVDLAGNRAKAKRKETMKIHWLGQLIDLLEAVEADTGVNVRDAGFDFMEQPDFREAFYQKLHAVQPEFEESPFNNARLQDFIELYRETDGKPGDRVQNIMEQEADGSRRLPEVKSKTQLEVVVDYLREVTQEQGTKKIRKLWLPVLPENLYLDSMADFRESAFDGETWPKKPNKFRLKAVIGMADDPANQAQFPISLDFAQGGHHLLVGTVSTGKSTFAQSVVYSLISTYSPDLLNVYCLDFSAKMLSVLSDAPHVGGYLDEEDVETDALSKFFNMMTRILDERKARYSGTSFADVMNHNGWKDPAILIVIDNYGNFHEKTEDRYEAEVTRLVKEGNAYGVYLLVTAGGISMQDISSRMAENFRTALTLEMPDPFAYGEILHIMRPDVLPEARVKGRGLIFHGERLLEFQTALAAPTKDGRVGVEDAPSEQNPPVEAPERNDRVKAAVKAMRNAWKGAVARGIPKIPEKPNHADFAALEDYRTALENRALLPVGYNFDDAGVYSLNLAKNFAWLVSGTRGSGKSTFLRNVMLSCEERGEEIHIIELQSLQFQRMAEEHGWKRYADAASIAEFMLWLAEECIRRDSIKAECRARNASDEELFEAAQANPRINLFIMTPLALAEHLSKLDDAGTPPAEEGAAAESAEAAEGATEMTTEGATEATAEAAAENAFVAIDAAGDSGTAENATETPESDSGMTEAAPESVTETTEAAPKLAMPIPAQLQWLSVICERGVGYNLGIYVEVSDKDLDNNLQGVGIPWFTNLADYRSGIRFGGMLNKQHDLLPFENVGFRDAGYQSSVRPGVGFLPTDRADEKKTRLVIPMV